MGLRWIPYSRVSMQRAGMLPIAVSAASERRPITLERAGQDFNKVISRERKIPGDRLGDFSSYLSSLRVWKRYGRLQEKAPTTADAVAVQDLWLADPRLRAATGAITPEVIEDIPQLAVSLRLLRAGNFTRTDRGRALLAGLPESYRKVIKASATAIEPNPLLLPVGAQILLLYALLEADGDFIKAAYQTSVVEGDFSRPRFADELGKACREMINCRRSSVRTGQERKRLIRLGELEKELKKPRRSGSEWGGGRTPEQLATLRLEPYVDLGVLTRADRYKYRYLLTDQQRAFIKGLQGAKEVEEFLRESLVGSWCEARQEDRMRLQPEQAWPWIMEAYEVLRSSLGQASFVEVTLLAIGSLLESQPDQYFELADGIEAITQQRQRNPERVRLGINRSGALTYMKIIKRRGI